MPGKAVQRGRRQSTTPRMFRTSTPAFILFLVVGTFSAACSNNSGVRVEVPTPDESSSTIRSSAGPTLTSSATADYAAAIEAEVQERYKQYRVVVAEAGAASDPDDPRLEDYATGGVLANLRGTFAQRQAEGRRLYGQAVPHVSAISVTDGKAVVEDCLDNSATGVMDATGAKLSVGRAEQLITVTLIQEGGVWKVAEATTVQGGGDC